MVTASDSRPSGWTPGRIAGLVVFTGLLVSILILGGRALLSSDEDPTAGLAEQAVFNRLVVIPANADVLIEPAWAATFYGSVLIPPEQASSLLPDGDMVVRDAATSNAPVFSYVQYADEGEWTCLAYADFHDAEHPSPLVPVEQMELDQRTAFESGDSVLANIGAICGTEDQFPDR
jgi:hypothetical protein